VIGLVRSVVDGVKKQHPSSHPHPIDSPLMRKPYPVAQSVSSLTPGLGYDVLLVEVMQNTRHNFLPLASKNVQAVPCVLGTPQCPSDDDAGSGVACGFSCPSVLRTSIGVSIGMCFPLMVGIKSNVGRSYAAHNAIFSHS
jgi:hypothetical protein